MPSKEYKYTVVIRNKIDNSDAKKNINELERELTNSEKRQKKQLEWIEKNSKKIEAAMKAAEIAAKVSAQAFTDFQKMMSGLSNEVGKLKTSFDALKTSIEAAANAKRKFGNTFGTGGGGGSGGKLVFDTTEAEKSIITLIKKKESLFNPSKIQIAAPNLETIEKNLEGVLNSIKNLGKVKPTLAPQLTETEKAANKAASMVLRLDNQIAKLSGNDTELGKLNRQLAQNGIASKIDETTKAILRQRAATADALKAQNSKSSFAGDIFKSAFAGASVAGLAVAAVTLTLNTIKAGITAGYDQAVAAGVTAAGFERTKIALSGVIGSATQANIEIANLEKTAQNTKGLTFQTALDGYQRLRAVQFGAKDAERALVGLSKVKILSGGTKEDLEAVLINFAQIRSVGKLTGDELRETLGRFPYFAQVLQKAFGTISTEKIGELGLSSDEFFARIFEQLDKVPSASGGASEAFDKLTDSFFKAQIAFGEPLLEPATDAIINLTSILDQNKDTFKIWGDYVGDILRGVASEIQTIKNGFDALNGASNSPVAAGIYNGVQIAVGSMVRGGGGSLSRRGAELRRLKEGAETSKELGIDPNEIFDFSKAKTRDDEKVRNYKQFLRNLDDAEKIRLQNVENFYSQQQAVINSGLKYTLNDELEVQKKLSQSQVSENQAKINSLKKFISDARTLNKSLADSFSNPQDKKKIEAQKELELMPKLAQLDKLRGDAFKDELSNRQKVLELEKQIGEQKRQSLIDAKNLQIEQNRFSFDKQISDVQRAIDKQFVSAKDGYAELIDLTQKSYQETSRLTLESYQLQLQDLSLTNEKRLNLTTQMYLSEQKLAEENQRSIIDIQDRAFEAQVRNLENYRSRAAATYQSLSETFSSVQNAFFNPSTFSNSTTSTLQEVLLKKSKVDELKSKIAIGKKAENDIAAQRNALPDTEDFVKQSDLLTKSLEKSIDKTGEYQDELNKISDAIPKAFFEFEKLSEEIGKGNVEAFDKASKKVLEYRQLLARTDAQAEIDHVSDLIKLEEIRAKSEGRTANLTELNFRKSQAQRVAERLGIDQAAESVEQYQNSLEGLRDTLAKYAAGDTVGLKYEAERNFLIEQKRLYQDVADYRYRLSQKSVFNEVEASAKILAHIEQNTTSASDLFANAFIDAFDRTANQFDKLLDKFGIGKIPILGDIVKAQSRNLLGSISTNLLDLVFPDMAKTGNPVLDENVKQTKSLEKIEKVVTQLSAGGVGSVLTGGGGSGAAGGAPTGAGGVFDNPNVIKNLVRGGGAYGTRTGDVVNDTVQVIAGDKGRGDLWSNLKFAFSKKDGAIFGKNSPIFGKEGFGNNVGTYGAIGAGAGILGGLIGGRGGRAISYAGTGLALGAQLGSIIPGIGTAIGAVAGAAIGGLVGLIMSGGQRKKDEKTRNQGMIDALGAIDKLIAEVNKNPDFTDVGGVVSQGQQIRQTYMDAMSQLKDNKTRNIAMKDVSRIDAKLRDLESIAKAKAAKTKSRSDALNLDVPTFADGGAVSRFIGGAYQNNPLGYITGPGSSRSDSILARVSNKEYIFDAETTRNIGVAKLDALRAAKGRLKYMTEPVMKYADGGSFGGSGNSSGAGGGGNPFGGITIDVKNSFIYNEATDTTSVQTDVVGKDASGKEFIIQTVVEEMDRKQTQSEIVGAHDRVKNRQR